MLSIQRSLLVLATIATVFSVIYVKPVLLPLLLALLIAMMLRPIHRALCRVRVPEPVSASLVVFVMIAGLAVAFTYLAAPATEWGRTLDLDFAEERIRELFQPVQKMQQGIEDVAKKVDAIAEGGGEESGKANEDQADAVDPDAPSEPVKVEVTQAPEVTYLDYIQDFGIHAMATLLLVLFLLAYGSAMGRRIAEWKNAAGLFDAVSHDVSAYLFTITAINFGLGLCVGATMWWLEMPNPILWGVMAMLLNYIPYLGAVMGTAIIGLVSVVTFATPSEAALPPILYYCLTALEGNVITPMIIGRRFSLNPIVVVVWFLAWGAMWGIAGMLIATPTLMAFKIVCGKVKSLDRIERVISR